MKTPQKVNSNGTRNTPTRLYNPWSRLFRNDLLDFWDGDPSIETIPSINIAEEKDKYKVEMAAPGMKKEDFNIDVERNVVTIYTEKESKNTDGENKAENEYFRREYDYSYFSRSFTLPDHADADHIIARYADGILHITIPKKADAPTHSAQKIKVQ